VVRKVSNFEQRELHSVAIRAAEKGVRMTDQWDEELRCPQCRRKGMVSLSQNGDNSIPTVDNVADGFKTVQTEYGPNFECGACNVTVEA